MIPISGRHIYQDHLGRTAYYDSRSKLAYLIQEKDAKTYRLYSNRYLIALLIPILGFNFAFPPLIGIALGIGVALLLEFRFRKHFLPNLSIVKKFKLEKRQTVLEGLIHQGHPKRNLSLGLAYALFAVLLFINGLMMTHHLWIIACNALISLGALYFSGLHLYAYTKRSAQ